MIRELEKADKSWREYISPLRMTMLAINWICFCVCIVLVVNWKNEGLLLLLLIGTGLCFIGGLIGAIIGARKRRSNTTKTS
jgi:hypothetical protein